MIIINYDCIVHVPLSNSTTIDDLFCKIRPVIKENGNLVFEEISSNFINALNREKCKPNTFIVIENLDQASKNILKSLIPIFNSYSEKKILLTNVNEVDRGEFTLIAIFDPLSKNSKIFNSLNREMFDLSILFIFPVLK